MTILKNCDFLHTSLPAEVRSVGLPVVEDVPVTVQLHHAAVVVAAVEHGFIGRFISVDVHIAIADDYAAVLETLSGMLAGGVAQFVLMNG